MNGSKELFLFLHHARGSRFELQTQVQLAQDLEYLSRTVGERLMSVAEDLGKIVNPLINALKMTGRDSVRSEPTLIEATLRGAQRLWAFDERRL